MRFFTSIYLLLLIYIMAALAWWEIDLQKQSAQIFEKDVSILRFENDSLKNPAVFIEKLDMLKHKRSLRKVQFVGEGTIFLVVILIGSVVVYTSFARRIRLSRQQNNFMLSVTHELKSPIATMKLNLQTLEKHKLDEDKKRRLTGQCIKEANRLNDLCNNMLFASQLEGRQYKPAREKFDLSEMVDDSVKEYASRYSRIFQEDIQPGCIFTGDKVMLQMAINNLLENAVKYTPDNMPVEISLNNQNDMLEIMVKDHGAGIPDKEKKKIFNKFYRIGNEESRKSKGTGLGLYLTNKIVKQHKGLIFVKDNMPNGAIFEILLPA